MPQMHAPRYVSPHVTHVARDAFFGTTRRRTRPRPLAVYRRIRATSVRSLSCFVLDRCLPRGVLVVYIFSLAQPLARASKYRLLFPPLCIHVFAASRLKSSVPPIHETSSRAVGAAWALRGLRRHRVLFHSSRIHTCTSLSLLAFPARTRQWQRG